ncbi:hypothetical protein EXS54_02150 [Patescibacteria group bacterium]|nr:hypothetical protein [Patescibacteria group bacterium]
MNRSTEQSEPDSIVEYRALEAAVGHGQPEEVISRLLDVDSESETVTEVMEVLVAKGYLEPSQDGGYEITSKGENHYDWKHSSQAFE